jgi:hypothetical protein
LEEVQTFLIQAISAEHATNGKVIKFCHRLRIDEQPTGYDGKTDCYSPSFTISNFASSDVMLTEGRDGAGDFFPLLWAEAHWAEPP